MTNIHDMTAPERSTALTWAKSHDWGREAHLFARDRLPLMICVWVGAADLADEMAGGHCLPDVRVRADLAGFTSMGTLRAWAGY